MDNDDAEAQGKDTKRRSGYDKLKDRIEELETENAALHQEITGLQARIPIADNEPLRLLRRWHGARALPGTAVARETGAVLRALDARK